MIWFSKPFPWPFDSPLGKTTRHNSGHRSAGHRAVAGARVGGDDADLSPCRPAAEGGGPRQGDAVRPAAGRFRPDDELLAFLEGL